MHEREGKGHGQLRWRMGDIGRRRRRVGGGRGREGWSAVVGLGEGHRGRTPPIVWVSAAANAAVFETIITIVLSLALTTVVTRLLFFTSGNLAMQHIDLLLLVCIPTHHDT